MKQRKYSVLLCQECGAKSIVRDDRAKTLDPKIYLCNECSSKKRQEEAFFYALGNAKELIKETHVQDKHRWVLVDCLQCSNEYWARFDNWEEGGKKCWACAHPGKQGHGKTGTALYKRWLAMLRRTEYSKEPDKVRIYQDRGIKVCDEWRRDFEAFERWAIANGFKEELFLDRIDNYKGYSPDNCRWVTAKESTDNRRKATYI